MDPCNSGPPTQLGCSLPTPGQPIHTNKPTTKSIIDRDSSIATIETVEGGDTVNPVVDQVGINPTYNSPSPPLSPRLNFTNSGDLTTLDNLVNGETDWTTYNETNKWGDTPSSSRSTSPSWPHWWNQRVDFSPSPPITQRGASSRVTWDDPLNKKAYTSTRPAQRNGTVIDTNSVSISFSQLGIEDENGPRTMEGRPTILLSRWL